MVCIIPKEEMSFIPKEKVKIKLEHTIILEVKINHFTLLLKFGAMFLLSLSRDLNLVVFE